MVLATGAAQKPQAIGDLLAVVLGMADDVLHLDTLLLYCELRTRGQSSPFVTGCQITQRVLASGASSFVTVLRPQQPTLVM